MDDELINTWIELVNDINNGLECSSEKTLCYQYAWRLNLKYMGLIEVDFERKPYDKDFSDGMFLDLYIKYKNMKIGIEFKYMKSGNSHNTNQTETRVKIVNDIKRLTYLKSKDKITNGYFFCMTNEMPYTYLGNKKEQREFKIYDGYEYKKNIKYPINNKISRDNTKCLNTIIFSWNGVDKNKPRYVLSENIKYAWLSPIKI
jgi:hypothetical protein